MAKTLYQVYREQLKDDIPWQGVIKELEGMKGNPDYETDESGIKRVECFIGTVFGLAPSGKYYTAWAHSNVTTREANRDMQWYNALERLCEEHELYLTNGDSDPCDLFIGMTY